MIPEQNDASPLATETAATHAPAGASASPRPRRPPPIKKKLPEHLKGKHLTDDKSIEPLLVSLRTTSRVINQCPATVAKLIKEGKLEAVRIGSRVMVKYPSLKRLAGL